MCDFQSVCLFLLFFFFLQIRKVMFTMYPHFSKHLVRSYFLCTTRQMQTFRNTVTVFVIHVNKNTLT